MTSMIGKLVSPLTSAVSSMSAAASGLMRCRRVKVQKSTEATIVVQNAIKPLPFAPTRLTSDVYSIGFHASKMNSKLANELLDQNPNLQSVIFGEGEENRVRRPRAIRVVILDNSAVEEFDDNEQVEGVLVDSEADTDTEKNYRSAGEEIEGEPAPVETSSSDSDSDSDLDVFVEARRAPRKPRRKEVETIGPIASGMGGMKLRSRDDLIMFNQLLKGRYFKRGDKLPLNAK